MSETIYAFATPEGRSAIAVLRLSGPHCAEVVEKMLGRALVPRVAQLVKVRHPVSQELVDQAIAIWNPGPASFTGEDCLELHLHGSRAVRNAVMHALGDIGGCRPAEAGEFTRRAFRNGKTNLSRLEGLADLLEAQTEGQRRQAVAVMDGRIEQVVSAWREILLEALALLEASIDFSDEADVPGEVVARVDHLLTELSASVQSQLERMSAAEIVRSGFRVVIAGPPNAGKSSLLNTLARRDVAIVTDVPGTTRDLLEVSLELDGNLVILVDSAGIRDTDDKVERIGIDRARGAIENADLVLWLVEPGSSACGLAEMNSNSHPIIYTKFDLYKNMIPKELCNLSISARTGHGIGELLALISRRAQASLAVADSGIFAHERQRVVMKELLAQVENAKTGLSHLDPEIVSEHLRLAGRSLARLIGAAGVEDVLGAIFARFCIGK